MILSKDFFSKYQNKVLKWLSSRIWKTLKSSVVIFKALETSSTYLTSAVSATSAASTASKCQFPQKKSDPDGIGLNYLAKTGGEWWRPVPKRFIPPFWKMMTLYVKGDSFEIPGNKEIAAKMDTCSSISLTWFRNFWILVRIVLQVRFWFPA